MGVTWRIPTDAFGVQGLVEIGMLFTEGEWASYILLPPVVVSSNLLPM